MPDQPEAPATPWPDWLADLTPEQRSDAIAEAVANCYEDARCGGTPGDHEARPDSADWHLSWPEASRLLRRLIDEARQHPRVLPASLAEDRLTVAVAALTRLMLDELLTELRDDDDRARLISRELTARMQYAAGTLETIRKLGEMPDRESRSEAPVTPVPPGAFAALTRLSLANPLTDWVPANGSAIAMEAEMAARRELAAAALAATPQGAEQPEAEPDRAGWDELARLATGSLIRQARQTAGMSQSALAEVLGVTQTSVSYWESGKRGTGVGELLRIAGVLRVDAGSLLPASEPASEAEPEPLPPGFFGRVELPGFRNYTGWITQDGADRIVSDWDGNVLAEYQPGPNCLTIHLPTPQKRPEPPKAITPGPQREEDDDPDDYAVHVPGCRREDCDGACSYGRPF